MRTGYRVRDRGDRVASEICHTLLDDIELPFANERLFKGMSATEKSARPHIIFLYNRE